MTLLDTHETLETIPAPPVFDIFVGQDWQRDDSAPVEPLYTSHQQDLAMVRGIMAAFHGGNTLNDTDHKATLGFKNRFESM